MRICLYILAVAMIAVSCKKDLGNYSYHVADTPAVDTSGMAAELDIEQYQQLTVDPKIQYGGDTANLSYQWSAYIKSISSPSTIPPVVLGDQKKLDIKLNLPPGNYYLELLVTDKKTNITNNARFLLNVMAAIETGWLVLHSRNNESEVDFIVTKSILPGATEKRMSNLFTSTTGAKMPGTGQCIDFSRRSNSDFNWITVGTSQEMRRVHGFTFALLQKDQQLFRRTEVQNPQALLNNTGQEFLINSGQLHDIQWSTPQDALFSGAFRGDYNLAPYFAYTDYSAMGYWVYDQKYMRFMYTTSSLIGLNFAQCQPAAAGQPFSPGDVGKQMMFMDRGMSKYVYAFFKDPTGPGRYMYVMNITKSSDDGQLGVSVNDISALPAIADAKYFAVGGLGNVALYATDKAIYRYDYSGTKQGYLNFDGIGAGETITGMKIFRPDLNSAAPAADYITTSNTVLFVATWDGTQGRLYELSMNIASGILNPKPIHIYEGFGRIMDMAFKFRGTGV